MAHVGRRFESEREARRGSELDRVLAGQAIASARELIALIHEVNPTGREVDPREAARRYARKTRLQSLLVRRFSDEMEVVRDGGEGLVLLRHKYLGLAASHAIVADLEEDARAWVQMQLDLGVVAEAWTRAPGEIERRQRERGQPRRRKGHRARPGERADGPGGAVAGAAEMGAAMEEGRGALKSYDYEAARDAFERAHGLAPGAPAPLAALLDLLVNQLGLDQEALDFAEGAECAALQSPTVRAALALAAARLGERERAEAWGGELDGAAAAEVFRALAAGAIGTGELAYAAMALERARQGLSSDPERIAVEARLDRARAAAVVEDEGRLARLLAEGDATAATELAHWIVEKHPGSAQARAVLKEAAARERRLRQGGLLDEARTAVLAGRFKQARQALASARECGAAADAMADLECTLVAAEARAARIAHESMLQVVAAQLSGAALERRAAVAAYLGLDRQDRDAVHRQCDAPELPWLDEVPPATPAARAEPIAAAVMAARAAAEMMDGDDIEGAGRAVAPHRLVLGEHGFGRRLLARLAEVQRARERVQALAALEKAGAALRAKDVEGVRAMLGRIARDRLPASSQEEFNRLTQVLAAARMHQARMQRVDDHLAEHRPIRARQLLLERLAENPDEDERGVLRDRLAQVDMEVRKKHVVFDHVPPAGYLASEAPEMVCNYKLDRGVDTLLLAGGRTAVQLSAAQGLCAARLVDVDTGEIRRLLAWTLMETLTGKSVGITDERVWIGDVSFNYAEISCESWLPCRQSHLKPDGNPADMVERWVAVPGADVAWLRTRQPAPPSAPRLRPLDIARGSVIAFEEEEGDVYHIPGTTPPVLAWFWSSETLFLVTARGAPETFIDIPPSGVAIAVAVAPDGDGYVVLCQSKQEADPWLELLLASGMGRERAHLRLPVAHQGAASVATIRSRGLLCVAYRARGSGQSRLAYVRQQNDDQLVLVGDVKIPGLAGIAQDPAASTAVAVCESARGLRLTRLDDMPTVFPAAYEPIAVPRLFRFLVCSPRPQPTPEGGLRSEDLAGLSESAPALSDGKLAALAESVDRSSRAVTMYRLLRVRGIEGRASRLLEYMERQNTTNVLVRLAVAEREAVAGRWVGDDLEPHAAAIGASDHWLHVRAVAHLRAGQLDRAIECLTGRAVPGTCRLDSLLALAQALAAERAGDPVPAEALDSPGVTALVHWILAADRALAQGDRDEALRVLDRAWIRELREVQSMARLADLYLATTREDPAPQRFKAATLLADFVDCRFPSNPSGQLWLGESTWSVGRLATLTSDAEAWLGGPAWTGNGPWA